MVTPNRDTRKEHLFGGLIFYTFNFITMKTFRFKNITKGLLTSIIGVLLIAGGFKILFTEVSKLAEAVVAISIGTSLLGLPDPKIPRNIYFLLALITIALILPMQDKNLFANDCLGWDGSILKSSISPFLLAKHNRAIKRATKWLQKGMRFLCVERLLKCTGQGLLLLICASLLFGHLSHQLNTHFTI